MRVRAFAASVLPALGKKIIQVFLLNASVDCCHGALL